MMNMLSLSSLMGISSINWMSVWFMMEVNTLAMCFIMTKDYNKEKNKKTNTMTYFLVQMLASSLIIVLVSSQSSFFLKDMFLFMCLMIKMGVWPFHLWYLKILSSMEMKNKSTLLVMTWQKLLPVTMMSMLEMSQEAKMVMVLVCLTSLAMPITKVKLMQNNMMMAMSSLNNNSWLIMASSISPKALMTLITFYSLVLILTTKYLSTNAKMINKTLSCTINYLILFANLSGMPPLTMFWMKLMIVSNLMNKQMNTNIMGFMVVVSCIMVSLYLMMLMPLFMKTNLKTQNMTLKMKGKNNDIKIMTGYSTLIAMLIMT